MSLSGSCHCNNIRVTWRTVDYSPVPRACQCDYCRRHDAAFVSKSGTAFAATVARPGQLRIARQGSGSASFHECAHCGGLVFVTALIDGERYGALNARRVINPLGFAAPLPTHLSDQSAACKIARWRDNWCHPVVIKGMRADDETLLPGPQE